MELQADEGRAAQSSGEQNGSSEECTLTSKGHCQEIRCCMRISLCLRLEPLGMHTQVAVGGGMLTTKIC